MMNSAAEQTDQTRALDTFVKLLRAAESVSGAVHRELAGLGLTVSQFGILEALYHLGPMLQKELAEKILKSPGNITMVIDNLAKRGLISRQKSPFDRRASVVTATDEGTRLIESIFPAHCDRISNAMSALTHEEQRDLGKLLKKLGRSVSR
jgi:MarR family 2-MHQ and catechol resistance regulon transcriptional repressor